ncbi:hypothetical protein ACFU9Y_20280 [Streptomyces sp. NPDC057621]|uniref:hypothetical protein n=1 Tax=Streptomyces sp. NPDC057621 TaxID=3346186 RepID=UPI0036CDB194
MLSLSVPYTDFKVECHEILTSFSFPLRGDRHQFGVGAHRIAREGSVIALHDAWNRFCKNLVLRSSYHQFENRSGQVLRPTVGRNQTEALQFLSANISAISSKSFGEPTWFIPAATIDAASVLNVPNRSIIAASIGVSSLHSRVSPSAGIQSNASPPREVQSVRNYIAHRSKSAAARVNPLMTNYGAENILQLLDAPVAGGIRLFESWVFDLLDMADFATR